MKFMTEYEISWHMRFCQPCGIMDKAVYPLDSKYPNNLEGMGYLTDVNEN
jgi:hypothetical protein